MDIKFVPKFSMSDIQNQINNAIKQQHQSIESHLIDAGQLFVENARANAEFMNHTFNLRSSIGYGITKDGVIIKSDFKTIATGADGTEDGIRVLDIAVSELSTKTGYALIVVAGEYYAGYVETKGFDVISISGLLTKNILKGKLGIRA